MWSRADLKDKAKDFLRKFYWKAFLVALVIAVVSSGSTSNVNHSKSESQSDTNRTFSFDLPFQQDNAVNFNTTTVQTSLFDRSFTRAMPWLFGFVFGLGGLVVLTIIAIAIGFRIFIGAPIEVGGRSFFYKGALADEEVHFAHLGMAFRKAHYMNVVWAMFYRGMMNFFFFLLLVIPGIIKHYGYSMVPYILAENPTMSANRALQLSEEMTSGQKFDMFILDLSFFGWYILGLFFFGLGVYFVNPYAYATQAQLYMTLRGEAIRSGICTELELTSPTVFAVEG